MQGKREENVKRKVERNGVEEGIEMALLESRETSGP